MPTFLTCIAGRVGSVWPFKFWPHRRAVVLALFRARLLKRRVQLPNIYVDGFRSGEEMRESNVILLAGVNNVGPPVSCQDS